MLEFIRLQMPWLAVAAIVIAEFSQSVELGPPCPRARIGELSGRGLLDVRNRFLGHIVVSNV